MGTLYLCATPIGNLEDISLRVLRVLKEVDLIAAEDTRNSLKLLNHFDIHTPMTAYHDHNRFEKAEELVEQLLAGKNIALITDAGTPAISDPGWELVAAAYAAGVPVTSLPGANAAVTALTLSGLSTRRFCFEGFLPRDKKERRQILEELRQETRTIVLHEAPHHLQATLAELAEALGADRRVAICRELTKVHEEVVRTTLGDVAMGTVDFVTRKHGGESAALSCDKVYRPHCNIATSPRGEYVLVIEGRGLAAARAEEQQAWQEISIEDHMARYLAEGLDEKEAMKRVAKDRGVGKREIYEQLKT